FGLLKQATDGGERIHVRDLGELLYLVTHVTFSKARLASVLKRADIKLAADNPTTLAAYAEAAKAADRPASVLIECDTGRQRAGVETPAEAIELARIARDDPNLTFKGLLLYPPPGDWPTTQEFLDTTKAGLAELGLEAEIVSSGGTPALTSLAALQGPTEHRAGTSIFNDRMMMACGAARLEDCALSVYTTMVSRVGAGRGILDAGSKTLTSDTGGLDGHGLILEHTDAVIASFSEEHGQLDLSACAEPPNIGEVVRVIPNHVCVVVNMVDRLIGVRGEKIERVFTVDARGRLV
ncbi:MAG: alanine racemase, partial [Acidobacteriota bacterium]